MVFDRVDLYPHSVQVGKVIPVQKADPTLTFEESNYSYSNSSSPAPPFAMGKVKNSKRESLFLLFY